VTPTGAEDRPPDLLVDTSVAVALLVVDHEHHHTSTEAVGTRHLGLAGYAAFETFSVLTRLPHPARRPSDRQPTPRRWLCLAPPAAVASADLLTRLADLGVAGGAVHGTLVGATAAHHGVPLASRDRRAITYRLLDVDGAVDRLTLTGPARGDNNGAVLHHVVLFQVPDPSSESWSAGSGPYRLDPRDRDVRGRRRRVPAVPPARRVGLYSTFADAEALEVYRAHHAHQASSSSSATSAPIASSPTGSTESPGQPATRSL
jgi:hypothetical protein